jgi:hypothetical protein
MFQIGKKPPQRRTYESALLRLGQHVLQPVQSLDDPHARPVGPVEPAGGGIFEVNFLAAELDGFNRASTSTSILAGTAVVSPRSLAAVMPSITARARSRRITARMTAR